MRDLPGALVYVTRAAPVEWELLLFDVIGDPEYAAIVPGGGIEPGETAEEAAVRETLEETGLHVRLLRELGVDDGTHFFQAAPLAPTDDEWVHEGAVHCYWKPLVPGLEVWGARGDLLSKLKRQRVVAYVTRDTNRGRELLVFDDPQHPETGVQLPAGRLDPGEELEPALRREIAEESAFSAPYRTSRRTTRTGTRTTVSTSSRTKTCRTSGITSSTATGMTQAGRSVIGGCRSSPNFTFSSDPIR